MWSGPRNISTALMRSWETRPDCVVVDEPLYAHYLAVTDIDHPAREDVIAAGETDVARVVASLTGPIPDGARIHYQKHMTHHLLPDVGRGWLAALTNVLLIRDPAEVVASYQRSRSQMVPADIGLLQQRELYAHLVSVGVAPPVIDASDFLRQPAGYLEWLCVLIGVPFTTGMLSWQAGPRDTDGVWAPHWYGSVVTSTGFEPYRQRRVDLDVTGAAVARACQSAYDDLAGVRVRL